MIENRLGPDNGPADPINPYESPHAPPPRGHFLVRLVLATRRAWATYWTEIRRSKMNTTEHIGAWFTLVFGGLVFMAIGSAIVWWLITILVSEL